MSAETLITYLKQCLKPRDSTEFWEGDKFDPQVFSQLKQDGIMIVRSPPPPHLNFAEYIQIGKYHFIKKCFRDLEWLDSSGTIHFDMTSEPLYRRLLPPPEESVNHALIIASVIAEGKKSHDYSNYIEYGVRTGSNIGLISDFVDTMHGVDIADCPNIPSNCTFHKSYTNDFSTKVLPSIRYNFAFIDADHKFESCYDDFKHIYKHIDRGGYIFLHDTYPCHIGLLDPGGCNDCYKTPIEIKKNYPGIQLLTFPLNPGVTVIRRM